MIAFFFALPSLAPAAGKFIPAPGRIDMVYDDVRSILYITAGSQILRYDVAHETMLNPFETGGNLMGIDISPDYSTIAAADTHYTATQTFVQLVDLSSSAVQTVALPRGSFFDDGGHSSVAFASTSTLLMNSTSYWGYMRRYHLDTHQSETVGDIISDGTMLCASADRSVVGFAEGDISDGRFGRYRSSDGDMLRKQGYDDGTSWFNYEIGVNRDATQYAIPTYNGTYICNKDLVKTGVIIGTYAGAQPIGLVYNPVDDIVYFAWATSTKVFAYDTKSFAKLAEIDCENQFDNNGNFAYSEGRLKISADGKLLFCTVDGGVRYLWTLPAPVASSQYVSVAEDSPLSITLTASSEGTAPLSFQVETLPMHGKLSGTPPELLYTPDANFSGMDLFTYTADDGHNKSFTATVQILVNPVNDAPIALSGAYRVTRAKKLDFELQGSDPDGDPLEYEIVGQPSHGRIAGTAPNLQYIPAKRFVGIDHMEFKVSDGMLDSETTSITFAVAVGKKPVVAFAQSLAGNIDEPINVTLIGWSDYDQTLSYSIESQPRHGSLTGSAPNLVYQPAPGWSGRDHFSFTAVSSLGESKRASVRIHILP